MIVDDNLHEVQLLKVYVERQKELELVAMETDAYEARRFLLENRVDLLLLDVDMPRMDGIKLYGSLPDPPLVIFHTAHDRFAVDSYDLGAVDFLVKNMHYERFLKAIKRALAELGKVSEPAPMLKEIPGDYLFLYDRDLKMESRVPLSEIEYVEVKNHALVLYFRESTRVYSSSLKANLPILLGAGFIQVNRSYVVRKSAVYSTDGHVVHLWNRPERLSLGRAFAKAFMEFYHGR